MEACAVVLNMPENLWARRHATRFRAAPIPNGFPGEAHPRVESLTSESLRVKQRRDASEMSGH
jgi:hypothetical protein